MRNFLLFIFLVILTTQTYAAPGDTTWVQSHHGLRMTWNNRYDTTIKFPDGTTKYRKIIMVFTLGRYICPGSPQYCGDWDYTVSTYVRPKAGGEFELGRYITPYSGNSVPRISPDITGWKQRYEFDVTDYYNQLKDSGTIRTHYSGYSGGFTADVKFAFIEGTPPRDVVAVERAWGFSGRYGDASQTTQFEDRLNTQSLTAPAGTNFTELKLTVTGHGNDDNGCSEFCKKFYEVELNSTKFDKTELWRNDCGSNHFYPQNGTWIYNRGNWCPGDKVQVNTHKLAGVTAGNNFDLDVDFENYNGSKNLQGRSWGSYSVQGNVIYYGAFNKSVDASLDDIIAPSNHEVHFRENPKTGRPIVTVQNTGSTKISSIKFKYGISGSGKTEEFTWNGSLESLESKDIELGLFYELRTISSGDHKFDVEILEVNGQQDEDATNNKMSSTFKAALTFHNEFTVSLKTNLNTIQGVSENSWKITDLFNGNIVAERKNCAANTLYEDSVKLMPGMYKLEVIDLGCQGLSWWANQSGGTGTFRVRRKGALSPYPLKGYYNGDFGCGFSEYFRVDWPNSVTELDQNVAISVQPNPAQDHIQVVIDGIDYIKGHLRVIDMTGRTVLTRQCTEKVVNINTAQFANGTYTVMYQNANGEQKLKSRVVISK